MDNAQMETRGDHEGGLKLALELAFYQRDMPYAATHYADDPEHGLILLWTDEADAIRLPVPLDHREAYTLVCAWLAVQPPERYAEPMDHDGHNGKGWRVYREGWGRVGEWRCVVCAVQPLWAWYGK